MIACLKYRFSLTVHDRIIRVNLSGHKLFHNKLQTMKIFFMECPQLILTLQFISRCRTDAVIRLHDNRISHLLNKSKTFRQIRHQMIPGCWNTCRCIIRFHFRFILHMFHVSRLHSRNIKICSQSGILLQPVFIIAFKTIHWPMLITQKSHRPIHLIIVFHAVHLIVLCQSCLQGVSQVLIRCITNPEYIHAIFMQLDTEILIICWKMWRNKNKITHNHTLFFIVSCLTIKHLPISVKYHISLIRI